MFDTKKLIEAIQYDKPIASYKEYANWLKSHNDGEGLDALYLKQAIMQLADKLVEVGNKEQMRQVFDYVLLCERNIADKK